MMDVTGRFERRMKHVAGYELIVRFERKDDNMRFFQFGQFEYPFRNARSQHDKLYGMDSFDYYLTHFQRMNVGY